MSQWVRQNAMDVKEEHQHLQQPPRKIIKSINGEKRKYHFLKTVTSLEQLNSIRLKNRCASKPNRQLLNFKSLIMPCLRNRRAAAGHKCAFQLMALRLAVESGDIHVYAHSEHNHAHMPAKGKRVPIKHSKKLIPKKLMPDADPPTRLRTPDNMEWTFLRTSPDYDQMQKFRCKSQCKSKTTGTGYKTWQRIRFYCQHRQPHKCEFMLMAMKTTRHRYHVYTHGQHNNHPAMRQKKKQQPADRGHQQQQEIDKAIKNEQEEEGDDDDEGEEEDEGEEDEDETEKEDEKGGEMERDDEQGDNDAEEQQQKQPPRKMTKNIHGQKREYNFLKSVKSVDELDNFRFKNHCIICDRKSLPTFKSIIMPCTRKRKYRDRPRKQCDFELMALRQNAEDGTIDVYAHSKHNHPLMPEEKRAIFTSEKEMMPATNPPKIYCTPDNIEWKFVQTFADYNKMQKFRRKSQCKFKGGRENNRRVRLPCQRRWSHNCQFKLLALKTTNDGYHVYKFGEHNNHCAMKSTKKQHPKACDHQKQRKMEVDNEKEEEEKGDDEDEDEDNDSEHNDNHPFETEESRVTCNKNGLMPEENPPLVFRTPDKIEWTFLRTFADYGIMQEFRQQNQCKGSGNKNWLRIRFPCYRKQRQKCEFMLLAKKTTSGGYHVYTYGKHNNHPIIKPKKKQQPTACDHRKQEEMEVDEDEEEEEDGEDSEDEDDGEYDEEEDKEEEEEEDSEHNQPFETEQSRAICKRNELMPDEKPPTTLRTSDNIQWAFIRTFADYGKMQKFRLQNQCKGCSRDKKWWQIRFSCQRRWPQNCGFTLLAKKTTSGGYHVYKYGNHNNHPAIMSKKNKHPAGCGHSKQQEMEVDEEKEEENDGEDEEEEEEEDNEDSDEEDVYDEYEYHYLKTVKSIEELDKFRMENHCCFGSGGKPLKINDSIFMPCTKKSGKGCAFELMALRPNERGEIQVYANSEHNHPLMPEVKRTIFTNEKELMPDANPPRIYRTPDNIEWTFLRTFPDYDQMQEFRQQNQCNNKSGVATWWRIRFYCRRRWSQNCEFMLLAMKTTKKGFHVYKQGEHNNHPAQLEQQMENEKKKEDEKEEVEEGGEKISDEDEPIEKDEEGGGGGEEEDDIIMIDNEEDAIIEVEQQEEGRKEGTMGKIAETPLENEAIPREESLEEKLQKANDKVYKWMAGIKPDQIGQTLGDWDNISLLKMVQMADQEIRQHPEKLGVWRPFLKCAIKKCMSQIEGFGFKYKDLIILMLDNV